MREAATICPRPLQVDLWPFDLESNSNNSNSNNQISIAPYASYRGAVVSESCVTWATSVPILAFLGLCSRPMPDICDRQTSDAHHRLMPPTLGAGHNKPRWKARRRSELTSRTSQTLRTACMARCSITVLQRKGDVEIGRLYTTQSARAAAASSLRHQTELTE